MEEQRKGILTVGNALLVFSVIGGAISFLSAFSSHMPIDWSEAMGNFISSYHAAIREPLRVLVKSFGVQLPPFATDVFIFWSVFVIPVIVVMARDSFDVDAWTSNIARRFAAFLFLLIACAPFIAWYVDINLPSGTPLRFLALMIGAAPVVLLMPMVSVLLSALGISRVPVMHELVAASIAYSKSLSVALLVLATLWLNRVLIGYGF